MERALAMISEIGFCIGCGSCADVIAFCIHDHDQAFVGCIFAYTGQSHDTAGSEFFEESALRFYYGHVRVCGIDDLDAKPFKCLGLYFKGSVSVNSNAMRQLFKSWIKSYANWVILDANRVRKSLTKDWLLHRKSVSKSLG